MINARLLVIDDDSKSGPILKRWLIDEGYQVHAANRADGIANLLACWPDLVVLDVKQPTPSGIRICRAIRQSDFYGPLLMLSVQNQVDDRVAGLDAGADDFLGKPFDFCELSARIRALLRRHGQERLTTSFGDLELDERLYEVNRRGRKIHLSRIEFDLLALFMSHPQQVLGRNTIMDLVWGAQLGGYGNSMDVYISRLRRKIGDPPLIHTIRSIGYIMAEAPP